ncbi:MAG: PLP-dependent lyase/thiolase [Actinomycetota bacterium]
MRASPLPNGATGWRCAVCGARRSIDDPAPWRCPNATADDRRHVMLPEQPIVPIEPAAERDPNPFREFDHRCAWSAFAAAHGLTDGDRGALVDRIDHGLAQIGLGGIETTPFGRDDTLSEQLGFVAPGGVWVKDETGAVAGSQKIRHLASIMLHLLAAEAAGLRRSSEREPLAIASCGNAAVAAATLAAAVSWPIEVFVPTWMDPAFGAQLRELGAVVHRCPRLDGDPPGDPAMLRFREAVEGGAIPFTVQGPENALCLDGGRTIGWEIAAACVDAGEPLPDWAMVQVGGGAFAGSLAAGVAVAGGIGLHPVQTRGCAPLDRAWCGAASRLRGVTHVPREVAADWASVMTPWANPQSLADGLLDDETYDWIAVMNGQLATDPPGRPIVVTEEQVVEAHQMATAGGYRVSPTGSAGLAGALATQERLEPASRLLLVMSGVSRQPVGAPSR